MLTKLYQHIYDGGEGSHDMSIFIGYCKEEPKEVLLKLIKQYCIHSYKTMYCNPIEEVPANMSGLELYEITEKECNTYGIKCFKNIEDYLKQIEKYKWNEFSIEKLNKKINKLEIYYKHFDEDNSWKNIYKGIWKDFKSIRDIILEEDI